MVGNFILLTGFRQRETQETTDAFPLLANRSAEWQRL